jgi:hypothetical protein
MTLARPAGGEGNSWQARADAWIEGRCSSWRDLREDQRRRMLVSGAPFEARSFETLARLQGIMVIRELAQILSRPFSSVCAIPNCPDQAAGGFERLPAPLG